MLLQELFCTASLLSHRKEKFAVRTLLAVEVHVSSYRQRSSCRATSFLLLNSELAHSSSTNRNTKRRLRHTPSRAAARRNPTFMRGRSKPSALSSSSNHHNNECASRGNPSEPISGPMSLIRRRDRPKTASAMPYPGTMSRRRELLL